MAALADAPATVTAEANSTPSAGWIRRLVGRVDAAWNWLFGVATLIVGLAVLATLPVLQVLSLGYLLEAAGRVARTGRLRAGFIGIERAAQAGSILFGAWVLLWIPRLAASLEHSARLISPDSPAERGWRVALVVASVWIVWHTAAACARGGRLRHFLWPRPFRFLRDVVRGAAWTRARDAAWDFVVALRWPYYFWLGARGLAGGLIWLAPPITLLAAGRKAPVVGFLGGLLLAWVVLYLPFLQARFAAENRFRALFELRPIRAAFRRAPLAFLVALIGTLVLALPLYLLKIELVPREAAWLPGVLFIVSIWPARVLCGWALARAEKRETNRNWFVRLVCKAPLFPVAVVYVLLVYFTQFLSWYGLASLYEQHAFLVPAAF